MAGSTAPGTAGTGTTVLGEQFTKPTTSGPAAAAAATAASPGASTLPFTGMNLADELTAASIFLAVGGTTLTVARRRRKQA